MAVRPEECGLMSASEQAEVDRLETLIDIELKRSYDREHPHVGVTWSPGPGAIPLRIQRELIRRFEGAGWKVTPHYDQRDGEWWTLKPATVKAAETEKCGAENPNPMPHVSDGACTEPRGHSGRCEFWPKGT